MLKILPELFTRIPVQNVSGYLNRLRRSLVNCTPNARMGRPVLAALTPGIHYSAYFEHSFLADQ